MNPDIHSGFYRHYFESGLLNGKLRPLINSGVRNDGLLNLSADSFFSIDILMPPISEQAQIADFVDLVTDEIKYQEQNVYQLREQKKGLMQRLLTGAVRVALD
jgi:type I restriction enzyme S subunit